MFARQADDFADEETRLRRCGLSAWHVRAADVIERGASVSPRSSAWPDDPPTRLPIQLFRDLLGVRAGRDEDRYNDFGEVMNYCRRSANRWAGCRTVGETARATSLTRRYLLGLATDQLSAGCRDRLCQGGSIFR
jgi:hypothetical protein